MITLIHGEDVSSSREYLNSLKLKFIRFDALSEDIVELIQSLEGSSLFSDSQSVLIENLFSKKTKNASQIIDLVNNSSSNIFIYDANEISKTNLAKFKKSKSEVFKYPQTLFSFLDSILPNHKTSIKLFHDALKTSEPEILLHMLVRQFRLMLGLSTGAKIEETLRLAPWQRSKLSRQAQFFGEKKLTENYRKIYDIDFKNKTGLLPLPLKQTIDIWLSNL